MAISINIFKVIIYLVTFNHPHLIFPWLAYYDNHTGNDVFFMFQDKNHCIIVEFGPQYLLSHFSINKSYNKPFRLRAINVKKLLKYTLGGWKCQTVYHKVIQVNYNNFIFHDHLIFVITFVLLRNVLKVSELIFMAFSSVVIHHYPPPKHNIYSYTAQFNPL